jgi:hypothetical protein
VGAWVTETAALADAVACETLCAVTFTETEGTVRGAVYKPELEMIPVVEFPPRTPLTNQFTPVLLVAVTEALNCCDCPTFTLADVGEIVTFTDGPLP